MKTQCNWGRSTISTGIERNHMNLYLQAGSSQHSQVDNSQDVSQIPRSRRPGWIAVYISCMFQNVIYGVFIKYKSTPDFLLFNLFYLSNTYHFSFNCFMMIQMIIFWILVSIRKFVFHQLLSMLVYLYCC